MTALSLYRYFQTIHDMYSRFRQAVYAFVMGVEEFQKEK